MRFASKAALSSSLSGGIIHQSNFDAKKNTSASEPELHDDKPANDQQSSIQSSKISTGLFDGPWYYPASYLHRHVTVLRPIEPKIPTGAGDLRGRVVLMLKVNQQGSVDSYEIITAEPPGFFENAVIDAFATEQYAPGLIANQAVRGLLQIEVFFEPGAAPRTGVMMELPR
jgi:protein TonB